MDLLNELRKHSKVYKIARNNQTKVGVWCPDIKDREEIEEKFDGTICSINGIDSLFFKFHESGSYIRSTRSESITYEGFVKYCKYKGYGYIKAEELLGAHLINIEKNYKI